MSNEDKEIETIPVGPLGLVPLKSCEELGKKVDAYLVRWRNARQSEHKDTLAFMGYEKDSFIVQSLINRFGTGEGKGTLLQSVRGKDLFLMVDVCNHSLTYSLCGMTNHMSPDDHFADLKRIISAAAGKARRINVIMPFLYEGRQHRRTKRESLDCAYMLTELANMGIENFITFDAHDPRVQNATPLSGFDNFMPTYQFIKTCFLNIPDLKADKENLMIISPDEGAMDRAIYISNILGVDTGMFYKRRDYSKIVDGRNPIVAHEFLGASVKDKDVLIIDDMISSGESMLDTAKNLKDRGCRRVIVCATFGLFTNGVKSFREKYDAGIIDYVCTTNLNYRRPELLEEPWYLEADMSPYLAYIIDSINADSASSDKLSSTQKIQDFLKNLQNEDYQYFGSVIE